MIAPFSIHHSDALTPVVVEIPHAGLGLDGPGAAVTVAPVRTLARDADLYVDELCVDAPSLGATSLVANLSRVLVDLNRAADDFDSGAVEGGSASDRLRGVIWRVASDGSRVLSAPLKRSEYRRRLDTIYTPYHQALRELLDARRQRFGFAVLLCAHSMPTPRNPRPGQDADIVPGTQGRSSADGKWIDEVDAWARGAGLSVKHDQPYRGGFTTQHYGRPQEGIHVVQLEIARRLYMDQRSLERSAGFDGMRAQLAQLVERLVQRANLTQT